MTNLEKVTENVYTLTKIRGCNPSIVFTKEGAVFIDTAQWITTLEDMLGFAKERGPIKYLINTEAHIDHIVGNHWFVNVCPVVGHEKLDYITAPGTMDMYDYSIDVLQRQDPEGLKLMPDRKDYILNLPPQITFSERMTMKVGDHTFNLYHTPGHSDAQIAVHVVEERVVFVGDTVFSHCQTWLHSANIEELLRTLDFLGTLDVDTIVPGHGPVITKKYLLEQKTFIYEWIAAVGAGISKGWSMDDCIKNISFADRYPMDIGQPEMMEYVQRTNVIKCYKFLTGTL